MLYDIIKLIWNEKETVTDVKPSWYNVEKGPLYENIIQILTFGKGLFFQLKMSILYCKLHQFMTMLCGGCRTDVVWNDRGNISTVFCWINI